MGVLRGGLRALERARAARGRLVHPAPARGAGSSTSTCPIGILALVRDRDGAARPRHRIPHKIDFARPHAARRRR